jgi:DNA-binding MarR family transcriptional regulator
MSPGGLRPRHLHALGLMSERGPFSQQSLGEILSLDPSNVVGLLNELEERELITRRRDPADRRRHIVAISTAGEQALTAAYVRLGLVEDDLLAGLSAEERAILHDLLVKAVGTESPQCDGADEDPLDSTC